MLKKSDLLTPEERENSGASGTRADLRARGEGMELLLDQINAELITDPVVD